MAGQIIGPMAVLPAPPLGPERPLEHRHKVLAAFERGISQFVRPERQQPG